MLRSEFGEAKRRKVFPSLTVAEAVALRAFLCEARASPWPMKRDVAVRASNPSGARGVGRSATTAANHETIQRF